MSTKAQPKVAPPTPSETLSAAIQNLVAAAETYAASEASTTHSFTADGFRVRFAGGQLLNLQAL